MGYALAQDCREIQGQGGEVNVNISKSEYTGNWNKTVVCDRCKRIIASAQCNKKPREDEVSICRTCAVEMWTKEKEA
jgi:hypothetical protein